MRKKLKDTAGLTLMEMLCASFILILLCLMMGTGMQMALKSYHALTAESETQLLLSSLTGALTDKLRYCVVTVDSAGTTYKGCSIGKVDVVDGKVVVVETDATGDIAKPLLPDGAYGSRKYRVTDATVDYDVSTHSFNVKLSVKDTSLNISQTAELTVRNLSPVKKEGTPP